MAIILSCSRFNERRRLTVLLHDYETSSDSSSRPYHTSTDIVRAWYEDARARYARHKDQCQVLKNIDNDFLDLLPKMLHPKPEHRPNAKQLEQATRSLQCAQCNSGPEPLRRLTLLEISECRMTPPLIRLRAEICHEHTNVSPKGNGKKFDEVLCSTETDNTMNSRCSTKNKQL